MCNAHNNCSEILENSSNPSLLLSHDHFSEAYSNAQIPSPTTPSLFSTDYREISHLFTWPALQFLVMLKLRWPSSKDPAGMLENLTTIEKTNVGYIYPSISLRTLFIARCEDNPISALLKPRLASSQYFFSNLGRVQELFHLRENETIWSHLTPSNPEPEFSDSLLNFSCANRFSRTYEHSHNFPSSSPSIDFWYNRSMNSIYSVYSDPLLHSGSAIVPPLYHRFSFLKISNFLLLEITLYSQIVFDICFIVMVNCALTCLALLITENDSVIRSKPSALLKADLQLATDSAVFVIFVLIDLSAAFHTHFTHLKYLVGRLFSVNTGNVFFPTASAMTHMASQQVNLGLVAFFQCTGFSLWHERT